MVRHGPALAALLLVTHAHASRIRGDTSLQQSETAQLHLINTTYTIGSAHFRILGFEPEGEGHPIYVFIGGSLSPTRIDVPEMRFQREMASRGFVSAMIEIPGQDLEDPPDGYEASEAVMMRCGGAATSLLNVSRAIFAYGSSDSRSSGTSALTVLCGRPRADCAAGIALHGISLGGLLSTVAPTFAPGVTALLNWAAGTFVGGGNSCCGLFSGNLSCCPEDDRDLVVGGENMPCQGYASTRSFLDRSRRRRVISSTDYYYGDCTCPATSEEFADCTCDASSQHGARVQSQLVSGYECGMDADCIQDDGSGYYVPQRDEVQGNASHAHQGHVFWTIAHSYDRLNPAFVETDAPWGMTAGFDWLAQVARRPL